MLGPFGVSPLPLVLLCQRGFSGSQGSKQKRPGGEPGKAISRIPGLFSSLPGFLACFAKTNLGKKQFGSLFDQSTRSESFGSSSTLFQVPRFTVSPGEGEHREPWLMCGHKVGPAKADGHSYQPVQPLHGIVLKGSMGSPVLFKQNLFWEVLPGRGLEAYLGSPPLKKESRYSKSRGFLIPSRAHGDYMRLPRPPNLWPELPPRRTGLSPREALPAWLCDAASVGSAGSSVLRCLKRLGPHLESHKAMDRSGVGGF